MSITLANRGERATRGELVYDPTQLQPASGAPESASPGRWPFELAASAEAVLVMRVLPGAAGQTVAVNALADMPVQGQAQWQIPPADGQPTR